MTAAAGRGNNVAVQQDAAAISVDWQGFTQGHSADQFDGAIFVLDAAGQYTTHVEGADPTDQDADRALIHAGWQRTEPWRTDVYGRRVAAVQPEPHLPPTPRRRHPSRPPNLDMGLSERDQRALDELDRQLSSRDRRLAPSTLSVDVDLRGR